MKLTQLSIEEIRGEYLDRDRPITAHFLKALGRDPRQGVRKIYELAKRRYEREKTERLRLDSMLNFERVLWKSGIKAIAGVDEVGVGPLAGPVVAAAVVFPPGTELMGIDDSKRLDPEERGGGEGAIRGSGAAMGRGGGGG